MAIFGETDTFPIAVLSWAVGAIGVFCGLCVAATGRPRLFGRQTVHYGQYVRLLGLATAALGVVARRGY